MLRLLKMFRHHLCVGATFLLTAAASAQPAARAPFEDTLAQRMQACTACHGAQGRAAPDGYYPRIAGKPAGYLYNQLLNFRDGRRHYRLMAQMVDPLTDAYLWEIAQHFAALDPVHVGDDALDLIDFVLSDPIRKIDGHCFSPVFWKTDKRMPDLKGQARHVSLPNWATFMGPTTLNLGSEAVA